MYVQYGSGPFAAPDGWINFDASMTLKFERIPILGSMYSKNALRFPPSVRWGDISKGLPVAKGSCKGVYASHILEHLSLNDFNLALDNTKLIMQPGGIFRLIVPDLETPARAYVKGLDEGNPDSNSQFLKATSLGIEKKRRGMFGLVYNYFNTSDHLWMWDAASLAAALRAHGFKSVRRCYYGDCEDPMFKRIETSGRFDNGVAMEAKA